MPEVILNLLPVTEEEKGEFAAIAPQAEHIYTKGSAVTAEELARATVIFGWPKPERLAEAKSLRWFQTMWAGTDEYAGHIPAGAKFTSSSGSNQPAGGVPPPARLSGQPASAPVEGPGPDEVRPGQHRSGGGGRTHRQHLRRHVPGPGRSHLRAEAHGAGNSGGL